MLVYLWIQIISRAWTSCLGHGTPKLEFFLQSGGHSFMREHVPMRGECPRSLNGFELFLWLQLFNRTLSRNSKERFNWGLSVRFKAARKFYSEWCRVSCYLFLPEYVFQDFSLFNKERSIKNAWFVIFLVKLSEFYSPARKWKFRQSRRGIGSFYFTINRSAWRFQAKYIRQKNHPSSNGCRGITKIYLILRTLQFSKHSCCFDDQPSFVSKTDRNFSPVKFNILRGHKFNSRSLLCLLWKQKPFRSWSKCWLRKVKKAIM